MSNPFDALGNDVEDANDAPITTPREIVKKNTSSKKSDVPPPSANKDRARNNRPQPTGNEAAFKDKQAGRVANKARGVEDAKPTKGGKPAKGGNFDRHSRTGKSDSEKKIKQAGWTADGEAELENEIEGAEDAEAELKEESEPKQVKKSLEEYLKEQEEASAAANSARSTRKVAAADDEDVIVKEQEVFLAPTKEKKLKSKNLKTKNILDFDVTFSDDLPRQQAPSSSSRGRGNGRGRGGASSRGRGGAAPRGRGQPKGKTSTGPSINDEKNFPSLA